MLHIVHFHSLLFIISVFKNNNVMISTNDFFYDTVSHNSLAPTAQQGGGHCYSIRAATNSKKRPLEKISFGYER